MFWPRTWIHPRILMICPSHTPRSTHFKKKMVYCTSLHFLRHEQCKDGMGFWKHHVYFDEAGTSTPHRKTLQVWTKRPLRPRSSKVGDDAFSQQNKRVAVRPFTLPRSREAPVTVWSSWPALLPVDFILPSFSLLSEEGMGFLFFSFFNCVLFFKEYGCSKTERIQKWLGALSNALLKIHYKDE